MLNFYKKYAAKRAWGGRQYDPPETAYGKKLLILSCDPAILGDVGLDNKTLEQQNVIKLH
ncbi:hypothetical protein [Massilia consociata]|uniref:Uncharacterized protein n=1 Tax=Massilia consociata TaxID=760117 RepID=A0ABV6FCH9_9BURK